jgi:type II secretory pathway component PulF
MLKESNQEIPAVTQFVIDVSNFIQEYTLMILPIFGFGFFVL